MKGIASLSNVVGHNAMQCGADQRSAKMRDAAPGNSRNEGMNKRARFLFLPVPL